MRGAINRRSLPVLVVVALLGGGLASLIVGSRAEPEEPREPGAAPAGAVRAERRQESPARREKGGAGDGGAEEGRREDDRYLTGTVPGEGSAAAGEAREVARAFATVWVNRSGSIAGLEADRAQLVGLSRGAWAGELDRDYRAALAAGGEANETEGEIVLVARAPREGVGRSRGFLIVARQRLLLRGEAIEPFRYATYLARLARKPAGWALVSWEPQL